MKWILQWPRCALVVLWCAALCGCAPAGSSQLDEEKEPHFLEGKSRVSSMDYKAAIESFEESLEVNPNSASAHFELACLLADKEPDPAAAIYHYQSYLKLRPGADNADLVKTRITVLKQDLAKAVMPPAATPAMLREFERLAEENRLLRDQLEKWRAAFAARATAPPVTVPVANPGAVPTPTAAVTSVRSTPAPTATTSASRTYKVQAGDTAAAIARKYSLKLEALLAANPGLEPRRMKVGQVLNIPAP